MDRWEYSISTFTRQDFLLDELNKLGEQGWEAVAMIGEGHVLLKRHKPETESATQAGVRAPAVSCPASTKTPE